MDGVHRLHVSGLSPSVTHDELRKRFGLFGSVKEVYPSSKECANGAKRTYCILHLAASDAGHSKLMNTLNGTMWKGSKLKIAVAKPSYFDRIRQEIAATPKRRRKKRRKIRADGFQGRNFELVTPDNVHSRSGWIADSLVFPLLAKPDRPITLPVAKTTAWSRSRHQQQRATAKPKEPVTRARKIRIIMSRYGSRKTVFDSSEPSTSAAEGEWRFENGEWHYVVRGQVVMREPLASTSKRAYTDNFTSMLDNLALPQCAVPPPAARDSLQQPRPRPRPRSKSASPPPFVPLTRQVLYNDEDAHAIEYASLSRDDQDRRLASERERMRQLALSLSATASTTTEPVMRLKGGAAFASSSDDSSSSSSSSSDTATAPSRKRKRQSEKKAAEKVKKSDEKAKREKVKVDSLKDMFKPQEASSFSLMGELDADMLDADDASEEAEAIPFTTVQVKPPQPQHHTARRPQFKPPVAHGQDRFFELSDEQRRLAATFHRQDSLDEIERKHGEMQEKLTGVARKRHREAVRKQQTMHQQQQR